MLSKITNRIKDGSLGSSSPSSAATFAVVGVAAAATPGIVSVADPETFGDSPLRDFVADLFSLARPTVYAKAIAGSVAGTISAVKAIKTSSGTITVAGSPTNDLAISIIIDTAGGLNEAVFRIKKDGVVGDRITIPTGGIYLIPGSGITITFVPGPPSAGKKAFESGDTFSLNATAPSATNAEVLAAVDTVLAAKLGVSAIFIAGVSDAALWAALAAKAAAEEAKNNFIFFYCQARAPGDAETADSWVDALCGLERGSVISSRTGVVAGWLSSSDAFSGANDDRGALAKYAGRLALISVQQHPDWVGLGAIPGAVEIVPQGLSDAAIERLQTVGYVALRRYNETRGIYFTAGRLLVPETSDYKTVAYRRTMDDACRRVVEQQAQYLNADVGIGADGSPEGLAMFRAMSEAPLKDMHNAGQISGFEVIIPEGQNILSTETVRTKVRIVPRGKMTFIENEISYKNPALEAKNDQR